MSCVNMSVCIITKYYFLCWGGFKMTTLLNYVILFGRPSSSLTLASDNFQYQNAFEN